MATFLVNFATELGRIRILEQLRTKDANLLVMEHWCRQSSIRLNDRRNLKFQKFWKLLRVLGPGKLKYIWERKHYYIKKCFTFPYFLLRIVGKIGKTKSRKLWENRLTVQSVGRSVGPWSLWPGSWDLGRFKKNEKSKISILFFCLCQRSSSQLRSTGQRCLQDFECVWSSVGQNRRFPHQSRIGYCRLTLVGFCDSSAKAFSHRYFTAPQLFEKLLDTNLKSFFRP